VCCTRYRSRPPAPTSSVSPEQAIIPNGHGFSRISRNIDSVLLSRKSFASCQGFFSAGLPGTEPQRSLRLCLENTLSHGRDLEFMQPSRQPVRLLRYLPIQNVKDALRPKGPAVRSPGREAGGIGVISMSAEGAAQWECRALRPSDYGSRGSPPSRAGLFTAGASALARPVPSGSWCEQNNFHVLGCAPHM